MNIFYLDTDPVKAAQYQYDKHVVKMPLETAQMLSTICREFLGLNVPDTYKTTHRNHPCTLWAAETWANFQWLFDHGLALCNEYRLRYQKEHASKRVIDLCARYGSTELSKRALPESKSVLTTPPMCMDNDGVAYLHGRFHGGLHDAVGVVKAYRALYVTDKLHLKAYKYPRTEPHWWSEYNHEFNERCL